MAYACPVCDAPEADAEHLANHLAFTALLHDDEHADWLDDQVPDWADRDPDGLAEEVVEYADEVDHEIESEGHDHGGTPPNLEGALGRRSGQGRAPGGRGGSGMDEETRRILEDAREMTERMRGDTADHGEDEEPGESEAEDR